MIGTFTLYYDTTSGTRQALWSKPFALGAKDSGTERSMPINFASPTDAATPGDYMLVFQGTLGEELGAVVGNIVQAHINMALGVSFSLSGFHGGAAAVFESTATTVPFPTSGMLTVYPLFATGGGFGFPNDVVQFSMFFDGKPLINETVSYDFFNLSNPGYIDVGHVSAGPHTFTIRFASTTADLIYMNMTFASHLRLARPW
jgi:hypothetical protein